VTRKSYEALPLGNQHKTNYETYKQTNINTIIKSYIHILEQPVLI